MTIAFATIYGYLLATALGAVLLGTLGRRRTRRPARERLPMARVIRVVKQAA